VQDRIAGAGHPFDPHMTRGWMKHGQHRGRATAGVLVRIAPGMSVQLPARPWLRGRRIRSGLIHAPHGQAQRCAQHIRAFKHVFLPQRGSVTSPRPALRWRKNLPVVHQLRSLWQPHPARCSTLRIVSRLTLGGPSGASRRARWSVLSDLAQRAAGEPEPSLRVVCCDCLRWKLIGSGS
jgi:hypothetical protein